MKFFPILSLIAAGVMAQSAVASEISCTVTRTNKWQASDVMTHQLSYDFDASWRRGGVIAEGYLESSLLPAAGSTFYRFQIVDRRSMQTALTLATIDDTTGQVVSQDTEYGSISGAPASVINTFDITGTPYQVEVSCDVLN